MPKSKSTRGKKYVPGRWHQYATYLPQTSIDGLKDIFANIECLVEITLPTGKLSTTDLYMMRDYLNLGTALLHLGNHVRPELKEEVDEEWNAMTDAFGELYRRQGKTGSATCYAHEINALRRGFSLLGKVISAEFEREPAWVLDVFHGVKVYTDADSRARISCDMDALEKLIYRLRAQKFPRMWRR